MKRTDKLTSVIAIALFAALLLYVGIYAYRSLSDQTVTADAVTASVSVGGVASGIVVRQETLLVSDEPYIDVTAANGAKVASGEALAMAMSSQTGLERVNRIHELELEISRVTAALNVVNSADDLTARDENLRSAILELTGSVARGEVSGLDSTILNIRSLLFSNAAESASESQLSGLQAELASLKNSSSSDTTILTADSSGTFSDIVDGYEKLSYDDLTGLTPEKLRGLMDSGDEPASGAYGKLITDHYWYFAAAMSADDAYNLSVGSSAYLDFGSYYGADISAKVMSISSADDGNVAVVFKCGTALADTLAVREASASVVFDEYSGIRVPTQAIQTDDETQSSYVWVLTAMQLERKDVNIIYCGDGFVIAERGSDPDSLREGNTIVVSGKDLYEGKIME